MSERDDWHALAAFSPARLALGRAGNGLPTNRVLEFQLAHARARDAVQTPFDAPSIANALGPPGTLLLETRATDRHTYLMNPDAGRRLSASSRAGLTRGQYDAALIIVDGLSSTAIHAHGAALARLILGAFRDCVLRRFASSLVGASPSATKLHKHSARNFRLYSSANVPA
jgi:ethanolamine ammonia-lyase small subunit